MPFDVSRYPANWPQFSAWVRFVRAQGRCECTGQCGKHVPNPIQRRCCEMHHKPARWFRGRVVLTVAHLCDCEPPCAIAGHVIAACQKCHLRIDRFRHAARRLAHQQARRRHPPPPSFLSPPPHGDKEVLPMRGGTAPPHPPDKRQDNPPR